MESDSPRWSDQRLAEVFGVDQSLLTLRLRITETGHQSLAERQAAVIASLCLAKSGASETTQLTVMADLLAMPVLDQAAVAVFNGLYLSVVAGDKQSHYRLETMEPCQDPVKIVGEPITSFVVHVGRIYRAVV